jgi:DNA-binding MarR family transcriptional regulator
MPRKSSPADPDLALADRLHSAAIHLLRRVRREDERAGLSAARLSALSVIVFGGPIRISALARAEQVRTPTITPIVAALERDGLITKETDAGDARAVILRPTPKGERLMVEGRARRVAHLASTLRPLTAAERRTLHAAAVILHRTLAPRHGASGRGDVA